MNIKVEERVAWIKQQLSKQIDIVSLNIIDDSHKHIGHPGHQGSGHFTIQIVSDDFLNCSTIQRHRKIYQALSEEMGIGRAIHALSIQAKTRSEADSES